MNKKTLQNLALECIGLATAAGNIIDILIIIQRLASHIRHGRLHVLTPAMLSILDAGNHPSHLTGIVKAYAADWWTKELAPHTDHVLHLNNLPECLEFHRQQCQPRPFNTSGSIAIGTHKDPTIKDICVGYRNAALDSLHQFRQFRTGMQAKALSFNNDWQLTMQHASAFNRLYKTAVHKEGQFPFQSLLATSTPVAADCLAPPALIPKMPSIAKSSTL